MRIGRLRGNSSNGDINTVRWRTLFLRRRHTIIAATMANTMTTTTAAAMTSFEFEDPCFEVVVVCVDKMGVGVGDVNGGTVIVSSKTIQ